MIPPASPGLRDLKNLIFLRETKFFDNFRAPPTPSPPYNYIKNRGSKRKIWFFKSRELGDASGIIFMDFGASYEKSIFIENVIWV